MGDSRKLLSAWKPDRLAKLEERVSALERAGMLPAALGAGAQAQPAQLGVIGDFHKFSDGDYDVRTRVVRPVVKLRHAACVVPGL